MGQRGERQKRSQSGVIALQTAAVRDERDVEAKGLAPAGSAPEAHARFRFADPLVDQPKPPGDAEDVVSTGRTGRFIAKQRTMPAVFGPTSGRLRSHARASAPPTLKWRKSRERCPRSCRRLRRTFWIRGTLVSPTRRCEWSRPVPAWARPSPVASSDSGASTGQRRGKSWYRRCSARGYRRRTRPADPAWRPVGHAIDGLQALQSCRYGRPALPATLPAPHPYRYIVSHNVMPSSREKHPCQPRNAKALFEQREEGRCDLSVGRLFAVAALVLQAAAAPAVVVAAALPVGGRAIVTAIGECARAVHIGGIRHRGPDERQIASEECTCAITRARIVAIARDSRPSPPRPQRSAPRPGVNSENFRRLNPISLARKKVVLMQVRPINPRDAA